MFKLAACFWTALALTLPSRAEDTCHSDVESWNTLRCPVQYFAVESQNSRYWTTLFPDNPPFAYACLYLPSFDREFGFYLDGNELCWARAIGPCSMQMLSQFPVADFRSPGMKQAAVLLTCLHFPVLGNLLEGWDCVADTVTEEDPFAGRKRNMVLNFLQFREYRELSAAWVEVVVNPVLYSRLFVKRGRTALNPAVAAELRKTWDEAVTRRTFPMDLYRQYETGCDGNYCYFRGESGAMAEDLCRGEGRMRPAMRFLAWGLADMAMMDDLTPAGEQWVMKQCAAVRKYAAEAGDEPPPMVSSEWVEGFSKRVWKRMEQEEEVAREREKSMRGEFAAAEEEPEEKAPSPYSGEKYVRGFRERFLKPLGTNPLWKDLFPAGTEGKPAVCCLLPGRGICGFYLDGPLMGRAESRSHHPWEVYDSWFFHRVPERVLFPYEGIPDAEGDCEARVKREWLIVGREIGGMMEGLLTGIARGELVSGKGRTAHHVDDTGFCIVRGADGTERIMSAADADLGTVVELMDLLYTMDLLFTCDEDYLKGIVEKRAVLQGRTPEEGAREYRRESGLWSSRGGRAWWF